MNWINLWMTLFGTAEVLGLNMGFWVSMAAVALIVVLMNVVFWNMKPLHEPETSRKDKPQKKH